MIWTNRRPLACALVIALLCACAGGEAGGEAMEDRGAATADAGAATGSGEYDRASFVLCPALEGHRAELAALAGFEHDPERSLAGVGAECFVRGMDFGFVRVAISPAIMRTVEMAAGGFDTPPSPAPELGEDALFVDAGSQPHVFFTMGGLIIDVGAESPSTLDRETMMRLAARVRELLEAAN